MGSRVAELLGLPQIGYARTVEVAGAGVRAERSMDDMMETLEAPLPAAVTVVSEINEPRIPSLMSIMKAGKKPVAGVALGDLGLDAAALAPLRGVAPTWPRSRTASTSCSRATAAEQAEALVNALINEGVLGR